MLYSLHVQYENNGWTHYEDFESNFSFHKGDFIRIEGQAYEVYRVIKRKDDFLILVV